MGGAASIEGHELDYEALKASGVNFATAYQAIQKKALKGKSTTHLNDVSIHFLAIRQLSQNLKNQEKLEKHRNKILKSRSLPDALKHKKPSITNDDSMLDTLDDLNAHDLAIIVDHEFNSNTLVTSVKKKDPVAASTATAKPPAKVVKKPNLFLSCGSDNSLDPVEEAKVVEEAKIVKKKGDDVLNKQISPSQYARLSPQGTLHMGKWKIKENGIFLSESIRGGDTFGYDSIHSHGGFGASRSSMPTAMGSKNDFLLVATLGSGASGVVSEAIHLPTLTLVALKMLPVYNQQKRQHVSRELAVLYKNLADLKLIDDRLTNEDSIVPNKKKRDTCVNVLSLYNAFVDPKSGMINLVIEYMDGGSLEDLVVQGGCRDEQVLSDIAYQTCKGLCFLHQHKSVHRDIKPANILCSSNGDIKIADFGISKALDKTTGFAHSFVGTVCYMSPERIVGESYSFSCDIWSLGLTLLAVAKGRFPLSGTEGGSDTNLESTGSPDSRDNKANAPIGGAGGYWAMIKAICDEKPPVAGDDFSEQFNEFIDFCLRKNPDERYSAKALLETNFVRPTAEAAAAAGVDHNMLTSVMGSPIRTSSSSAAGGGGGSLISAPIMSPMAARNATAAVVRRASKEFPSHLSPSDRMDSKSTDNNESGEGDFPYHIRQSIQEDQETIFDNDATAEELAAASDGSLINAVRLEHLDRVLDKIVRKLTSKVDGEGADPFAAADGDDDDDDMHDDDLEIHHSTSGGGGSGATNNSSIESIDKLLFKEVETPEAKKAFRELHDDRKHDHHGGHHSHHDGHGNSHHHHHGDNGVSAPAPSIGAVADAKDDKVNSILKSSSSFKPHHDIDHHNHHHTSNGHHGPDDSRGRVHFSEEPANASSEAAAAPKPKANFRSRLKAPLELQIVDNDHDEAPIMLPVLPKSSSYFAGTNNGSNIKNSDDSPETPAASSTPAAGSGGAVSVMEPADYAKMLPKLNAEGLPKWEYLAYQLRLPFHLLKSAVKAKLGGIIDLEEC